MLQIFKYRFKIMISNRVNIFWVLVFPLVLVSLFYLAFSNISQENLYKENKVAVVTTNKNSNVVKMMKEVKDGDLSLFHIETLSEKEALKKLEANKVGALLKVDDKDDFSLTVKNQGTNQMIIQNFLDKYKQNKEMIDSSLAKNPDLAASGWLDRLSYENDAVKDAGMDKSSNNLLIVSFYSAIAMACLFGAFLASTAAETLQANISYQGARVHVSPYSKWRLVMADVIASFGITLTSLVIMILYMNFVLKIEFNHQLNYIILIITLGALFSTCLGYFIALLLRKKEVLKSALLVGISMLGSFLAGMMGQSIKYYVELMAPLVKYINPVGLITDSLSTLYYYNDFKMIQVNLLCLAGMSAIMIIGSGIILRRARYDSL